MIHYADSSVLCSIYASDGNSSRADLWRQANPVSLPFTSLHRLEIRNAFFLMAFQERQTRQDAITAWQGVEADISAQVLVATGIAFTDVLHKAESMIDAHTFQTGARSLDILHVASAVLLGATEFVTFDRRQADLAGRIGLQVAVI